MPSPFAFGIPLALALIASAHARTARAEAPVPAPNLLLGGRDENGFRHDGFFARAEVGLSLLSARISPPSALAMRTAIQAWGQSSRLSFGGTPARGLVVGGFLATARLDPAFIEGGARIVPDDDSVKVTLVQIGPFFDWYPNPRRGFHARAGVALALQVESDAKGNPIEPAAFGPSTSFGLGYEWFLLRSWSLGVFGGLGFGRLARTIEAKSERTLWETLELGLTSTYH